MTAIALVFALIQARIRIPWYVWAAVAFDAIASYHQVHTQIIEWFGR